MIFVSDKWSVERVEGNEFILSAEGDEERKVKISPEKLFELMSGGEDSSTFRITGRKIHGQLVFDEESGSLLSCEDFLRKSYEDGDPISMRTVQSGDIVSVDNGKALYLVLKDMKIRLLVFSTDGTVESSIREKPTVFLEINPRAFFEKGEIELFTTQPRFRFLEMRLVGAVSSHELKEEVHELFQRSFDQKVNLFFEFDPNKIRNRSILNIGWDESPLPSGPVSVEEKEVINRPQITSFALPSDFEDFFYILLGDWTWVEKDLRTGQKRPVDSKPGAGALREVLFSVYRIHPDSLAGICQEEGAILLGKVTTFFSFNEPPKELEKMTLVRGKLKIA